MESVKPEVNRESVERFLRDELSVDVRQLSEITDGQISRTYSLEIDDRPFVLQFSELNMSQGCLNERLFAAKFRNAGVPIRTVLHEGEYSGLHYTIAARVTGTPLHKLPPDQFTEMLPAVIDLLAAVARVDTSDSSGFGWLDCSGNGKFSSWAEHLGQVKDEEPGDFYDRWHTLFDTTFLDKSEFFRYFEKMNELIPCLPSRRELIHGGFGYGNIIVDDGRISALLDWQDARYGDHVFALAYCINWLDPAMQKACLDAYRASLSRRGETESDLERRIACYRYYTGIDGLRFAAKTKNESFYNSILDQLRMIDTRL